MLLTKKGFPEVGELVLCTVNAIHFHSVFMKLDEYNRQGLIHISEIAPGRIRNIRDYVVENKKIVCVVLAVSQEKGHIDLSLRRVNEGQKRAKINEIKQEQIAEKIVEMIAKQKKLDVNILFNEIHEKASKKYSGLHACFEDEIAKGNVIASFGLKKEIEDALLEAVRLRIKLPIVKISGELKLVSYKPDGIDIIRSTLLKMQELSEGTAAMRYKGGGKYHLDLITENYKKAEKLLDKIVSFGREEMTKNSSVFEFERAE